MVVGGGTLDEAGKILGLTDDAGLAGLAQRLAAGGVKTANAIEPTSDYGEIPIPKLSGAGYRSTLLVPTAYKESVELSLVPFVSNVGSYLQAQGFLGTDVEGEANTSDFVALALDIAIDPGNLATLGTAKLLTQTGRLARTVSTVTKGGKAGTSGEAVVQAAIGVLEQAGKYAKAKPEILAAAKAGDKAAVNSILKAALASDDIAPEAAKLIKDLKKDSKYVAQLLDHAAEITAKGQLHPSAFLQATRAERIATGQINPLLRIAQPANPFRNPGTLFRQVVGIEYQGDKFYAPGSRLFAEGLDKILPRAGESQVGEVSFDALARSRKDYAGKLAEAEGRAADAPGLAHSQKLMDRLELISGMHTDHIISMVTEESLDPGKLDSLVRRVYNYAPGTKISQPQRDEFKRLVVNAANGARQELDALTLASREATFQKILSSRTAHYEAFSMLDSAMAKADLADLRALHKSFNLTPIIADPQGVGNAVAARVSMGRLYASQQGFIAREIVRAAYPSIHDADQVANGLGRFVEHMDLFDVRDGRMFLKADEEAVKKAAPLLHDALYGGADRRLLKSLTTDGLHPDVHGLVQQQRQFLDAVGPVLLHEGVIGGQITGYFPHVFQPNAKFYKTFDVGEGTAGRFFERLVISTDSDGELATQVLGASLKGEFDGFLAAGRQGKVSSQQSRALTERMAVAFERAGYGTYERDSLKVFAGYAAAANEALLVNRMIYDLPKSGLKLNRDALVAAVGEKKADAIIARLGGEAKLNQIDRFHTGQGTVPEELREIFAPLTSTGRLGGGIRALTSDAEAIRQGLVSAVEASRAPAIAEELRSIQVAYSELQAATRAAADAEAGAARKVADKRVKEARREADKAIAAARRTVDATIRDGLSKIAAAEKIGRAAERRTQAAADRAFKGAVSDIAAAEVKLAAEGSEFAAAAVKALDEITATLSEVSLLDGQINRANALHAAFSATPITSKADTSTEAAIKKFAASAEGQATKLRQRAERLYSRATKLSEASSAKAARLRARIKAADLPALDAEIARIEAAAATEARAAKAGARADAAVATTEERAAKITADKTRSVYAEEARGIARVNRARAKLDEQAAEYAAIAEQAAKAEGAAKLAAENIVDKRIESTVKSIGDATPDSASNRTVYAFKGDANPLIEALRLYPSEGHSAFSSWYDNFNRNLKSVVLFGDFFYFNTLGMMQFIGAPEKAFSVLMADAKLIPDVLKGGFGPTFKAAIPGRNAAVNALAGAIAGGVAGEALGAEGDDQLAFSLAGALYGAAIGAAIRGGRKARLQSVMGDHGVETLFWMGHGTWTGRPEDRAIGVLSNGLKKIYANLSHETAGRPSIRRDIVEGAIHLADAYESTLYGMLHNGGKTVLFQHYWTSFLPKLEASEPYKAAVAKGDEQAVFFLKKKLATEIVQATNNAFGGQKYAMLFGSPHVEKHLKRFLVSPDYTASRLSFTAAMLGNMGPIKGALVGSGLGTLIEFADAGFDMEEVQKRAGAGAIFGGAFGALGASWQRQVVRRMGVKGDAYANIARRMTTASLIGGYVTYNLLNHALTGHWMHENEPGKRLSVGLPNGQYLTPGKPFLEAFEFAGVLNPDKFPIPAISRIASKASPPIGMAKIAFNRDYYGQAIFTPEMSPGDKVLKMGEVIIDSTTPIPLRRPLQAAGRFIFQGQSPTETDLTRTLSDISGLAIRGAPGPTGRFDPGMLDAIISAPPLRLPGLGNPTNLLEGSFR